MSDRAKQKFFEAVSALIGPKPLRMRLTYAAEPLLTLHEKEMPTSMLKEFEELRNSLTTTPLSHAWGFQPRNISPTKARKLADKILSMYTELMGGL